MKILKIVGGLLIIIILAVVALGIIMPEDYQVERTVNINAPKQIIWKNIASFKAMDEWSPWREMDPNQTTEYFGEEGEVGSGTRWVGDPETVGTGSQELILSDPMNRIETKLKFEVPWEAENDVYITLADAESGFDVTWGFTGKMAFPMNVLLPIIGIEEGVGSDFEKGLQKLKEIAENQTNLGTYQKWEVKLINHEDLNFVAISDTLSINDMEAFFSKNFPMLYGSVTQNQIEMAGMPSALFYYWDEENNSTYVSAAIPLATNAKIEGLESISISSGKAIQIDYYGAYEGSGDAHWAMEECLKDYGFEFKGPAIEEYVTDPTTVQNPEEILTRITYPIKG